MTSTTEKPSTAKTVALAVAASALLLGAAGCSGDGDATVPAERAVDEQVDPVAEDARTSSSTTAAEPGQTEVMFVYSDEPGEEACRYEGPPEVRSSIISMLENSSRQDAIFLTLARLSDEATVEDWRAHLASLGDSFPVSVRQQDHNPAANDWMQGDWLELHVAGPGSTQTVEREALFEGTYVAFCWRDNPGGDGSLLWPAGSLTVQR